MRVVVLFVVLGMVKVLGQSAVDFANLREDVRVLTQRVGELGLRVEQLERENAELRQQTATGARSAATVTQLNEAIADLNRSLRTVIAASRAETLESMTAQLETLAQRTDTAIQALARTSAGRAPAPGGGPFSDDFPKEGISYTVQKGDTIAIIARRTGAKVADIVNANRLTDPSRIQAGQVLFVPGGR
jgi:nucleoid-associated protein YgaU